ncbi:SpaA isopeptide-forming pilin-related protein [Corynebacterium diphtheriae]
MKDVALSANEPTHIKFTNSYTIPMQSYTLQKFVEGDPSRKVIADDATFRFRYTCTLPYVFPDQSNPISGEVGNKVASGVIDLHEGQLWRSPDLPRTTSCTIKEEDDAALRTKLENNALRMVPTYLFPTERAGAASAPVIPPLTGRPIYNGTEPRLQMPESGIELNDAHSHTVVINNVYTTDAEINIAKVNADNSPLPGAHFAVYGIGENGQRKELPEVADVPAKSVEQALFAVRLRPGSYELVETQAPQGAQLLPKPWRFDVKAANAGAMGDLEVTLDNYDADSGLISVERPQGKPWLIKVANVSASTLPLTGSNGYVRWLLAGAAGLLVAAALWLVARRKR